ncbi:hypothetical protein [uncultured Rummeliibacillus sp.]|uniref:hypothetical protein n=1 Tax=uncultured Rummeliibacillus sp. TaxID=762292 RepID=UPI002624878F|nr:hypothetical protein [uncultured Rummeliibacillus sp.]
MTSIKLPKAVGCSEIKERDLSSIAGGKSNNKKLSTMINGLLSVLSENKPIK